MKFSHIAAIFCFTAATASAQNIPPLGTPPALVNDHPQAAQMVELGRLLFFDPRLSGDASTSCAECHSPETGFGDGAELSRGYPGTRHWRNSQTVVNSAYLKNGLHWDGTVPSLLHQVPGAMGTSVVANIDSTLAEERLRQIPEYVQYFRAVWSEQPSLERVADAIAAYEQTLVSLDSPFDAFARGEGSLEDDAARGYFLFSGKAGCINCHNGVLATDEDYHNTSVPPNPEFRDDPLLQITFRVMMNEFGLEPEVYDTFDRDPGRYAVTKDPADMGKLRTPPLRYLKYTAPYMHNGVFYTLEEVVDFYNNGGTDDVHGTKSPLIQPLGLTELEKADLVAFLESMSGSEIIEDFPDIPDYGVRLFPSRTGELPAMAAVATPVATPEPVEVEQSNEPANSGLSFGGSSDGLTIKPSGS